MTLLLLVSAVEGNHALSTQLLRTGGIRAILLDGKYYTHYDMSDVMAHVADGGPLEFKSNLVVFKPSVRIMFRHAARDHIMVYMTNCCT